MGELSRGRWQQIGELFDRAVELPPAEREVLLAEEGVTDPEMVAEVRALLEADEEQGGVLDRAASDLFVSAFEELAAAERAPALPGIAPGTRLGPYRIVREIGRGGMSVVFLAERADGRFEKQVAIKVLMPGGGHPDERLRRFRAERAILARLEHRNIAKVLDGGETEAGWPYLVMDYVEGLPITEAASEAGLSIEGRLALVEQACEAVDYAHQRLVVHRDLKPSNILVSLKRPGAETTGTRTRDTADGWDVAVKLLDFGIAKLLVAELDEAEDATRTGFFPLTPDYAAPEQIRGDDITMATDVHALGVLLYELLTGRRPYRLAGRSLLEMERALRKDELVRPSQLVARGEGVLPATAAAALRGDLDAIVLKALDPEPARRYSSARGLLEDLRRYREGLPVEARAPTALYTAGKFVRRHALATGFAAAFLLVVTLLVVALAFQMREASLQRDAAEREAQRAEKVVDFLVGLFRGADARAARGEQLDARELVDRGRARIEGELGDEPAVRAAMLGALGDVYASLGDANAATELLREELALRRAAGGDPQGLARAMLRYGVAAFAAAQDAASRRAAVETLREAEALSGRVLGPQDALTIEIAARLAERLSHLGELEEARAIGERALARLAQGVERRPADPILGESSGSNPFALEASINASLGEIARAETRLEDSASHFQRALELTEEHLGPEHLDVIGHLQGLGSTLIVLERYGEAAPLLERGIALADKLQGEDSPSGLVMTAELARMSAMSGERERALAMYDQLLVRGRVVLGPKHPNLLVMRWERADALKKLGRLDEARDEFVETLLQSRELHGPGHPMNAYCLHSLGLVELEAGRLAAAREHLEAALAIRLAAFGEDNPVVADTRRALAELEERGG